MSSLFFKLAALWIGSAILVAGIVLWGTAHEAKWHTCDAPCVVNFPEGTMEDEFQIDFTHDGLHVWKQHVDD